MLTLNQGMNKDKGGMPGRARNHWYVRVRVDEQAAEAEGRAAEVTAYPRQVSCAHLGQWVLNVRKSMETRPMIVTDVELMGCHSSQQATKIAIVID